MKINRFVFLFMIAIYIVAFWVVFTGFTAATRQPVCQCECATPTQVMVLPSTPMSAEDWFEKVMR